MYKRRNMLGGAAAATAGTVAAASSFPKPAIAQSMPEISWRLHLQLPKSLDTIYGAGEVFAKAVAEATDNRFQIQVFAAGEIVPGLQAADAVTNGTVECCHTSSYYYVGKDPTFAFGADLPFGLNTPDADRLAVRGRRQGPAERVLRQAQHPRPAAAATRAARWAAGSARRSRPWPTSGLKMRIGGFAGQVDAASWAWSRSRSPAATSTRRWRRAPSTLPSGSAPTTTRSSASTRSPSTTTIRAGGKAGRRCTCSSTRRSGTSCRRPTRRSSATRPRLAHTTMQARYDAQNPAAIKQLVANGAQLRPFSPRSWRPATRRHRKSTPRPRRQNADFKKLYDRTVAFRAEQYLWWQVAEYSFDSFMIRARAQGRAQEPAGLGPRGRAIGVAAGAAKLAARRANAQTGDQAQRAETRSRRVWGRPAPPPGTGIGSSVAPRRRCAGAPGRWRLTASFPKSLDTIYGATEEARQGSRRGTDEQFLTATAPASMVPGTPERQIARAPTHHRG